MGYLFSRLAEGRLGALPPQMPPTATLVSDPSQNAIQYLFFFTKDHKLMNSENNLES